MIDPEIGWTESIYLSNLSQPDTNANYDTEREFAMEVGKVSRLMR